MATESVVSPVMMNRPIVDPRTGSLTQYGYSLLSGLQLRTGGTVGEVVDIPTLEEGIDDAKALAESAAFAPPSNYFPAAETLPIGVESLMAEVAALRSMIEDLQKGYQL